MKHILGHILQKKKEGEWRYSQSRVYLLLSLIFMVILLTVELIFTEIPMNRITLATDTVFYLIIIFSGYALAEKPLDYMRTWKQK